MLLIVELNAKHGEDRGGKFDFCVKEIQQIASTGRQCEHTTQAGESSGSSGSPHGPADCVLDHAIAAQGCVLVEKLTAPAHPLALCCA